MRILQVIRFSTIDALTVNASDPSIGIDFISDGHEGVLISGRKSLATISTKLGNLARINSLLNADVSLLVLLCLTAGTGSHLGAKFRSLSLPGSPIVTKVYGFNHLTASALPRLRSLLAVHRLILLPRSPVVVLLVSCFCTAADTDSLGSAFGGGL